MFYSFLSNGSNPANNSVVSMTDLLDAEADVVFDTQTATIVAGDPIVRLESGELSFDGKLIDLSFAYSLDSKDAGTSFSSEWALVIPDLDFPDVDALVINMALTSDIDAQPNAQLRVRINEQHVPDPTNLLVESIINFPHTDSVSFDIRWVIESIQTP